MAGEMHYDGSQRLTWDREGWVTAVPQPPAPPAPPDPASPPKRAVSWRQQFRWGRIAIAVGALLVVVMVIANLVNRHDADSTAAGTSYGQQIGQVVATASGYLSDPDVTFRCQQAADIAQANGYGWQTGEIVAGSVHEGDFVTACVSEVRSLVPNSKP